MSNDDSNNPDPGFGFNDEREAKGFLPDFVKKVAVAGLGALFMTEEGIRSLAGQLKLPKEMLGFIVSQAERTKDEVGRVVSEEVRRFLQSEKLREEFLKLVSGMTVEMKAEFSLKPRAKGPAGEATTDDSTADMEPSFEVSELKAKRSKKSSP